MTETGAPAWLLARPIAHRGLHAGKAGVVENSVGAARAAVAAGYAIECDVQRSRDGEAVVFHDERLERLTAQEGPLAALSAAELTALPYRTGGERIVTLSTLLEVIAGRVPLICEIKSGFDGDTRLADRVAELVAAYPGPLALKSFDPAPIEHLRRAPPCPLGIVAEASYDHPDWAMLDADRKRALAALTHFDDTRPDFLSYCVDDLPHAAPHLCRTRLGCPVMAWTVRSPAQRATALLWADQMVFEGFRP